MHLISAFATLLLASEFNFAQDLAISGQIRVQPAAVKLVHRRQPQSLLVLGQTADGTSVDATGQAEIRSGDENIVRVENGRWLVAVNSGSTSVTVNAVGQSVAVPVEVNVPAEDRPVSFLHEVMPVLSKGGCNAGACHGYSLGKNGFKLSLRGGNAEQDWPALAREQQGRRIDRVVPENSIIIAKPLGRVAHEGGVRFKAGGLEHQTLVRWVSEGAKSDFPGEAKIARVEVVPNQLVLRPGQPHQLQLIAHYSDGSQRDVTRWGVYSANNPRHAEVDGEGRIVGGDLGETAIVARFERKFAAVGLIVLAPRPDFQPTPVVGDEIIDRFVIEKLNRLRIAPSPIADDETYLRRVYLDLIGIQPTPEEVLKFAADTDANKRLRVVDELFTRREFVDQWSLKWGDLLQNTRLRLSDPAMFAFREWIRGAIAENMPLDEMVRRVLTARGGIDDDPAAAYFLVSKDTDDTLQRATHVFCGVRMLCAKCHDHPMENWTQGDYYGLASFFTQVQAKGDARNSREQNSRTVMLNLSAGDATNPRTGAAQPPRYLGGEDMKLEPNIDRREVYARWLTAPENQLFARSMTNRIWSYFFHRGIIDPVDDMRSTNPPINPELLDALAADFVANKFDVRHLMRRIVTSQTYQRSSVANESNTHDEANFARHVPRRVPAEALLDSLVQATAVPESLGGAPGGFSAKQTPDGNITSDFLSLFGKPQRAEACECERDNGSNMLQALHLINGSSILGRVTNGNSRVAQIVNQKLEDGPAIEQLYLWSLARRPRAEEIDLAKAHIASYGEQRKEALEDLLWALLNSKDFLMIH
jgi:hypothetical protein